MRRESTVARRNDPEMFPPPAANRRLSFSSRTTAKYIELLALAVVIFHWKVLLTDQFTTLVGYEAVNQTYAWLHVLVRDVWSGHLPFWDPHAFSGRPFTEEMDAFYPLHLLFALVSFNRNGVVSPRFYHEYLAFSRFLGACFMFALLREFRRSHFASFIGACAFSMSGFLGRLPWLQYLESCIWLPAAFLFLLRALRADGMRRAWMNAALAGGAIGMTILTGGMQFAMMQMIFVVSAAVYYAAIGHEGWARTALILAVVAIAAFGMGAAQLLPSVEYGHLSIRAITGGWLPTTEKIPWSRLVHGMWPQSITGGLIPAGALTGGEEPWPYYIGVFPFFLVAAAIWKCWQNSWVRFLAILSVIVFAYTLGEFSPLFGVLYATAPLLWAVRGASRFVYLISFSLAILGAFGLDVLLDGAGEKSMWEAAKPFLKWIAIACTIAIMIPMLFTQITIGIWPNLSLLLIAGSCAWFYRLTLRPASPALCFLLAAFVLFDYGAFHWGDANKDDVAKAGDFYEETVSMRHAADFIRAQPGLHRYSTQEGEEPNLGDIYGLQGLWGGGATMVSDYSRLRPHEDLLNVQYRIRPASTADPGAIYHDALWKVYENPNAFPRAWVVHKTIAASSDKAAFALIDQGMPDLHQVAIIATTDSALPGSAATNTDSLRFRSYEADRMALDVNTASEGIVVLSEVYYPGWQASVNGQDTPILKVDGGLRGIRVSGGVSRLELRYVPKMAWTGLIMTLLTMIGCAAIPLFRRDSAA